MPPSGKWGDDPGALWASCRLLKLSARDPLLRDLLQRWHQVKAARDIVRMHFEDVQRQRVSIQDLSTRPVDVARAAAVLGTEPGSLARVFADQTVRDIGADSTP